MPAALITSLGTPTTAEETAPIPLFQPACDVTDEQSEHSQLLSIPQQDILIFQVSLQ